MSYLVKYPSDIDFNTPADTKADKLSLIVGETNSVPVTPGPYTRTLLHPPKQGTIAITGSATTWVETSPTPPTSTGQFSVSYASVDIGKVTFYSGDQGKSISINYTTTGDIILASHMDGVQDVSKEIETILGLNPQGTGPFLTVADRLDNLTLSTSTWGYNDYTSTCDGIITDFAITYPPAPNSITVVKNGLVLRLGGVNDYTILTSPNRVHMIAPPPGGGLTTSFFFRYMRTS